MTGRTVCCRSRNQRGPNKTLRSTYRGGKKKSTQIGCSFSPTRAIFLYDKTRLCRFSVCQRRALCERRCMNHRRVSLWLITSGALKRCYFICEMHPEPRKTSYSLLSLLPLPQGLMTCEWISICNWCQRVLKSHLMRDQAAIEVFALLCLLRTAGVNLSVYVLPLNVVAGIFVLLS